MSDHQLLIAAANRADWMQVVFNQGPPCFHLEDHGQFCLRAARWAGHGDMHPFVDLSQLLTKMAEDYDAKCAEVDALKAQLADIRSTIMGYGKVWEAIERLSRPDAQKPGTSAGTVKETT